MPEDLRQVRMRHHGELIWEARKNQDEDDDHDRVAANITGGDERSGLHNEA